jgi:hypothetical protein
MRQQARATRGVIHLWGEQRVDAAHRGAWLTPPRVEVVLIGHGTEQLQQREHHLLSFVYGGYLPPQRLTTRQPGRTVLSTAREAGLQATAEFISSGCNNSMAARPSS